MSVETLTCPKCGNREAFVQRVVEVRAYRFLAPAGFECKSAWSDAWDGHVEWLDSDSEQTVRPLGVFCAECGEMLVGDAA